MSNHSGGRMLNEALSVLKDLNILDSLDNDTKHELATKFIEVGEGHDCNGYDIINGFEDEFGICNCCMKRVNNLKDGLCDNCYEEDEE